MKAPCLLVCVRGWIPERAFRGRRKEDGAREKDLLLSKCERHFAVTLDRQVCCTLTRCELSNTFCSYVVCNVEEKGDVVFINDSLICTITVGQSVYENNSMSYIQPL